MYIDLSPLESVGKSAVRCKTEEHAQMFVDAMWDQYPKRLEGIWSRTAQNNWEHYNGDPNGICYLHRISYVSDGINYCQSTSFDNAIKHGYAIIEFEELVGASVDFGEVVQSEMDIMCLF